MKPLLSGRDFYSHACLKGPLSHMHNDVQRVLRRAIAYSYLTHHMRGAYVLAYVYNIQRIQRIHVYTEYGVLLMYAAVYIAV